MARSYNHVVLVGNLGRDPELRSLPSGKSVCSFTMATTRRYKDQSGQYVENTDWHKVELWGALAETASKYLLKGKSVLIDGEIRNDNYEKDGIKHYGYKIQCNNFTMLDNKQSGGSYNENDSSSSSTDVADRDAIEDDDDLPF